MSAEPLSLKIIINDLNLFLINKLLLNQTLEEKIFVVS